MGMSASQARFLILTAQKNNNEYQAQRITHERLVLAQNTESWTVEYNEKMNNKTLLFNPNTAADTDLYNYNKRLKYSDLVRSSLAEENPGLGARLLTSSGKVIVPQMPSENDIARYNGKTVVSEVTQKMRDDLAATIPADFTGDRVEYLDNLVNSTYKVDPAVTEPLLPIIDSVFCGLEEDDYFVDPSIEDPVALQTALQNGVYTIAMYKADPGQTEDSADWMEVNYLGNTATKIMEVLDKTDDADAQAKYDRLNSSFQQKDKMLELRLKQLESEHKALETEMESVKKVIQEDVEGSFKTFG